MKPTLTLSRLKILWILSGVLFLMVGGKVYGQSTEENYTEVIDSTIIKITDKFIMYKLSTRCGLGGICENEFLHTITHDKERISFTIFSSEVGDCSFQKSDENLILNDSLIMTLHREWKGRRCSDEEITEYESYVVKEFVIKSSGEIVHDRSREVNLSRDYYQLSMRLLNETDLKMYKKEELAKMRNELYAAHGYIFKQGKWANYFSEKLWYKPVFEDVPDYDFNLIELLNLRTIQEVENHQ